VDVLASEEIKSHGEPTAWLYQRMLGVIDALHTLWGGYETCMKASPEFSKFMDVLTVLVGFTSDSQLMRKFRATCLVGDPEGLKLMKSKAKVMIDWRWESMEVALDIQVPIHRKFRDKWDMRTMLSTEGPKLMQSGVVKAVDQAFQETPAVEFLLGAEGYKVLGKVIAKYAGLLEICDCHQEYWVRGRSWKKRKQLMGDIHCIWIGRRLAWFIACGYFELRKDLQAATSTHLQSLLAEADDLLRGRMVAAFDRMRFGLLEVYADKFAYLFHAPYYSIGAFHACQGGDEARSREILRQVVREVDEAIQLQRADRLHRVAIRLFMPLRPVRLAVDSYLADERATIAGSPVLFIGLQEYALVPFVCRRIERLHATIKRAGSHSYGIRLPYLCATIRERVNLDKIQRSEEFRLFCISELHSRSLLDRLLRLRVKPDELAKMSSHTKEELVYQCNLSQEYAVRDDTKREVNFFKDSNPSLLPIRDKVEGTDLAMVKYIKDVFEPGQYFTMPRNLFEFVTTPAFVRQPNGTRNGIARILQAAGLQDIDAMNLEQSVVIEITCNNPENRKVDRPAHIQSRRDDVQCIVCTAESLPGQTRQVIAVRDPTMDLGTCMQTMHGLAIAERIEDFIRRTCRYFPLAVRAIPALRPTVVPTRLALPSPLMLMMPQGVVQPPEPDPAQDVALVPVAASATAVQAVNRMIRAGQFCGRGSVCFQQSGLGWDEAQALHHDGALQLVGDDPDSAQLAVRSDAVQWKTGVLLTSPIPVCRALDMSRDVLKCTKIELLLRLALQGWENAQPTGPVLPGPGTERRCRLDERHSLSYLAAMVSCETIFEKGVDQIEQNQCDHYYRCLLTLHFDLLVPVITNMEGKRDKWFRDLLKREGRHAIEDESSSDGGDVPPLGGDPAARVGMAVAEPLALVPWTQNTQTRKIVSMGPGTDEIKVMFDHPSARTHKQQCWCPCIKHADTACIRWRTVTDEPRRMLASIYAWHLAGMNIASLSDRTKHMAYQPTEAEVAHCESSLVLVDY